MQAPARKSMQRTQLLPAPEAIMPSRPPGVAPPRLPACLALSGTINCHDTCAACSKQHNQNAPESTNLNQASSVAVTEVGQFAASSDLR